MGRSYERNSWNCLYAVAGRNEFIGDCERQAALLAVSADLVQFAIDTDSSPASVERARYTEISIASLM